MPLHAPKVSVIVPNYNHAPYLRQRLDSIFNQTFQDFEVILLDDASTDESVNILQFYTEKYKDKVSHFIINEENSGSPFRQWKKGIELARGEYLWVAESDDFALFTFLEKLILALNANMNASIGICNIQTIDENGNHFLRKTSYEASINCGQQSLVKYFTTGNYIVNASAAIFRKTAVPKVNWNQIQNYRYTGDWLFWCMVLKKECFLIEPEILSFFRIHKGNVSGKATKEGLFFLEGLEVYHWIQKNQIISLREKIKIYEQWHRRFQRYSFDKALQQQIRKKIYTVFAPKLFYQIMETFLRYRRTLLKRWFV
jgi:glycosyltransferase involved in cell wall biosynthesis